MDELKASPSVLGDMPVQIGQVQLAAVDLGPLTTLGAWGDVGLLEACHGVRFPDPGEVTGSGDVRCVWFGVNEALLMGAAPDARLSEAMAVVDQSDGWAALRATGAGAVDVLARLVPVDLRPQVFSEGQAVRSRAVHVPVSIVAETGGGFLILTYRSMAQTLVHELKTAMKGVAARTGGTKQEARG